MRSLFQGLLVVLLVLAALRAPCLQLALTRCISTLHMKIIQQQKSGHVRHVVSSCRHYCADSHTYIRIQPTAISRRHSQQQKGQSCMHARKSLRHLRPMLAAHAPMAVAGTQLCANGRGDCSNPAGALLTAMARVDASCYTGCLPGVPWTLLLLQRLQPPSLLCPPPRVRPVPTKGASCALPAARAPLEPLACPLAWLASWQLQGTAQHFVYS